MRLFYYIDKNGNFGDDLNAWLWPRLLPDAWNDDSTVLLCGIGSILNKQLPTQGQLIVFGSGTAYSPPPPSFATCDHHIFAVRGALTAKALGLPADCAVTDGAILLALLPELSPIPIDERDGVVFMPHHEAMTHGHWKEACNAAGITLISPRDDSKLTLERIRHSKLVIADAMHAAIVADAMRVPWIPVITSPEINTFKWLDWTSSMGLQYCPQTLPISSTLEACRGLLTRAFNIDYMVEKTPEAAISHYQHCVSNREAWQAPIGRRLTKAILKTIKLAGKLPVASSWLEKTDARRIAQTAMMFKDLAANGQSFLSTDEMFTSRRDEIKRRLFQMAELVGELEGKKISVAL